jgi:ElaB/YqjD/DUF883 family membrane-anchored ribosome-binding protein
MTVRDEDVEGTQETLDGTLDRAESWLEQKLVDVRYSARDEPIKTLAIAAAVGAVIGAIFLR